MRYRALAASNKGNHLYAVAFSKRVSLVECLTNEFCVHFHRAGCSLQSKGQQQLGDRGWAVKFLVLAVQLNAHRKKCKGGNPPTMPTWRNWRQTLGSYSAQVRICRFLPALLPIGA